MEQPLAIEARGLGRRFGKQWVVKDLDLLVPEGSVNDPTGPGRADSSPGSRRMPGPSSIPTPCRFWAVLRA